jgi:flagellar protein FlbD
LITVTRLNGTKVALNALLIETVEATPDTVITLTTGNKYVVREQVPEIIRLIKDYMQEVGSIKVAVKSQELEG